jgi:hypothetical protein
MFRHVGLVAMRVLCAPASALPMSNPRFQRCDNVSSPFDSLVAASLPSRCASPTPCFLHSLQTLVVVP